jgi:hypothetical protein
MANCTKKRIFLKMDFMSCSPTRLSPAPVRARARFKREVREVREESEEYEKHVR